MKSDLSKIFFSGWGIFLLVALFVAVALELISPAVTLPNGTRVDMLRGGSPVLGWLLSFGIFIAPTLALRYAGIAPVRWWGALLLCITAHFAWMAVMMVVNTASPPRATYTMLASLILMWRILRLPRIENRASKPSIPRSETSPTKPPAEASIHNAESTMPTPQADRTLQSAENAEPQEIRALPTTDLTTSASAMASNGLLLRRNKLLLGGLLVILVAFGFYGISKDENPPLTWLLITCGIWSISIYLMPYHRLRWLGNLLKWFTFKRTLIISAPIISILAFIGLAICMLTVGFEKPLTIENNGWEIKTIQDREYVTSAAVQKFYRFPHHDVNAGHVILKSDNIILEAVIGSKEILINNIKLILADEIIRYGNQALISRRDLSRVIDPVLRPSHINYPASFDTVVIDAGHGGGDSGVIGLNGSEKNFTLKLALELESQLTTRGFKVVMTRRDDSDLMDDDRLKIANEKSSSILISIHFNSGEKSEKGIKTLALASDENELKCSSLDAASYALATAVHGMTISRYKFEDKGVGIVSSSQFRGIKRPGIIFEGGYLSNKDESRLIDSEVYTESVSRAIADGIENYAAAMSHRPK